MALKIVRAGLLVIDWTLFVVLIWWCGLAVHLDVTSLGKIGVLFMYSVISHVRGQFWAERSANAVNPLFVKERPEERQQQHHDQDVPDHATLR